MVNHVINHLFIWGLLLSGIPLIGQHPCDELEILQDGVALIRSGHKIGAGMVIGTDQDQIYVLTVKHNVLDEGQDSASGIVWLEFCEAGLPRILYRVPATSMILSAERDLAVLICNKKHLPVDFLGEFQAFKYIETTYLRSGHRISHIGHGGEPWLCFCLQNHVQKVGHGSRFSSSKKGGFNFGDSGGPIFDRNMNLVGIAATASRYVAHIIKIEAVMEWLHTLPVPQNHLLRNREVEPTGSGRYFRSDADATVTLTVPETGDTIYSFKIFRGEERFVNLNGAKDCEIEAENHNNGQKLKGKVRFAAGKRRVVSLDFFQSGDRINFPAFNPASTLFLGPTTLINFNTRSVRETFRPQIGLALIGPIGAFGAVAQDRSDAVPDVAYSQHDRIHAENFLRAHRRQPLRHVRSEYNLTQITYGIYLSVVPAIAAFGWDGEKILAKHVYLKVGGKSQRGSTWNIYQADPLLARKFEHETTLLPDSSLYVFDYTAGRRTDFLFGCAVVFPYFRVEVDYVPSSRQVSLGIGVHFQAAFGDQQRHDYPIFQPELKKIKKR